MSLAKTVIRIGLIGGLAAGGLALIAGPQRVHALFHQARHTVTNAIDNAIDDPVALRNQLRNLEKQYPERIASVRGELASLDQQVAELTRDRDVANKVVELASADFSVLEASLAQAESARTESPSAIIRVRFDGRAVDLDDAYGRATQIKNTMNAYQGRAYEAQRSVELLAQQRDRLSDLLNQLETEHADFRAQLFQLDGQIEVIERNDRLIAMVQEREDAIRKYDKFETVSLDQVTHRMAKIRAEQEARLQSLASGSQERHYAEEAEAMLKGEATAKQLFEATKALEPAAPQPTIEVSPDGTKELMPGDQVASSRKIVVID
ncbi:MAG: hypothetical protein KDA20_04850 [Phycisphaerales bacterium]|nr:hypothetical protein [Phycisphaerales bacterium]